MIRTKTKLIDPPKECQTCLEPFNTKTPIYDAFLRSGTWAYVCYTCFMNYADGLGTGLGQKYEYNSETQIWEKTGG